MAVTIGSQLGSYEITALLGKGGFGEVYRAKDKKLKREVAIKILADEFSSNQDRLTRFQREAEVLASLNHPNIAAIYDLAAQDQSQFLVLELVSGETLADRIARGPIPVEEALNIAKQIAEALEAAHDKGVIHRDLKPANIKITLDGKVKVLDFGLAKIRESSPVSNLSNSPTLVTAATSGVILGTAAYMSPEQAKGKEADRATDIWAFGSVLYEMLTGKQAFRGEVVTEILSEILKSEPEWSRLPTETPDDLHKLLRRCLQKDANRRFRDARDVRIEIEEASNGQAVKASPRHTIHRGKLALIGVSALLVFLAAGVLIGRRTAPSIDAPAVRFTIDREPTFLQSDYHPAISPDGRTVAFVQTGPDGQSTIWLRPIDSLNAHSVSGTNSAQRPFWSPDSRTIGFFADGKLKKVAASGGSVQTLCDARPGGGTWNREGTILFTMADGLGRVSENGGDIALVTNVDKSNQDGGHESPQFLPDGNHFLYSIYGKKDRVVIGSLKASESKVILSGDILNFRFASAGYILFNRIDLGLFAQPFDPKRGELTGRPQLLADRAYSFSTSDNGTLTYWQFELPELAWFDRSGHRLDVLAEQGWYGDPAISPDARSVAITKVDGTNVDIWLIDIASKTQSRLTFDPALDSGPVWSSDGKRIAFTSSRSGKWQIYVKNADSSGIEELLAESNDLLVADGWDRRGVVYTSMSENKILLLPFDAPGKPITLVNRTSQYGQLSPDGRWVSYDADESGKEQVYIQGLPNGGNKIQVTNDGGALERWRRDGKEFYYMKGDRQLMAVDINAGGTISRGTPHRLFSVDPIAAIRNLNWYDVTPDGQKFLFTVQPQDSPRTAIKVILNWPSLLQK
jgi:serine/threonine protein kinase